MRRVILFTIMLVTILLSSCSGDRLPPSTVSTVSTAPVDNPESVTTAPAEQQKIPDIPIVTEMVTLTDLCAPVKNKTYILIATEANKGYLYKIYTSAYDAYIEYYETEPISADFFRGGSLNITYAICNTIDSKEYQIYGNRFYMLNENTTTCTAEELSGLWDTGSLCIAYLEGDQYYLIDEATAGATFMDTDAEDIGLLQFMYQLYYDRGLNINHFS